MDFKDQSRGRGLQRRHEPLPLRAMISHPARAAARKDVSCRIKAEMKKVGYDKVEIDGLGSVIG